MHGFFILESFRNKIQLSKLKDQMGSVEWFLNWETPCLANGEELQGAVQNGRLSYAEGRRDKDYLIILWGMEKVYQV